MLTKEYKRIHGHLKGIREFKICPSLFGPQEFVSIKIRSSWNKSNNWKKLGLNSRLEQMYGQIISRICWNSKTLMGTLMSLTATEIIHL
jgi:hypothetical protein